MNGFLLIDMIKGTAIASCQLRTMYGLPGVQDAQGVASLSYGVILNALECTYPDGKQGPRWFTDASKVFARLRQNTVEDGGSYVFSSDVRDELLRGENCSPLTEYIEQRSSGFCAGSSCVAWSFFLHPFVPLLAVALGGERECLLRPHIAREVMYFFLRRCGAIYFREGRKLSKALRHVFVSHVKTSVYPDVIHGVSLKMLTHFRLLSLNCRMMCLHFENEKSESSDHKQLLYQHALALKALLKTGAQSQLQPPESTCAVRMLFEQYGECKAGPLLGTIHLTADQRNDVKSVLQLWELSTVCSAPACKEATPTLPLISSLCGDVRVLYVNDHSSILLTFSGLSEPQHAMLAGVLERHADELNSHFNTLLSYCHLLPYESTARS